MRYSDSAMAHAIAEIDLSALLYNLGQVRKCIEPDCQILAVVKANAYGHGAVPVARALISAGVSMLGVAWVQEGIELRKAGVRLPILIMGGATAEECGEALSYRLTPVVYQPTQVLTLEKMAKKRNRKAKVHIKIDSGMGRLGAPATKEVLDLLGTLRPAPHLAVEGVMTHMAEDGLDDRVFTQHQLRLFQQAVDLFTREGINIPLRHVANSAITIDLQPAHFNMVRPGIMLYGYLPSKNLAHPVDLRPVMTLKTRILQIKRVPKGTPISYGRAFTTERESLIATLPAGYADGLPRALSNKGQVLVRSRRAPIVGRICMDMMMVDLTEHGDAQVGEEVILIGRQGQEAITADEIADKTGTIAYEILCGIGPRVSRVYIKGPVTSL
ncbi:MAG: alanine racemase [Nitrospiria bacterium]